MTKEEYIKEYICEDHQWEEMNVFKRSYDFDEPLKSVKELMCKKCYFPKSLDGDLDKTIIWVADKKANNFVHKHMGDL